MNRITKTLATLALALTFMAPATAKAAEFFPTTRALGGLVADEPSEMLVGSALSLGIAPALDAVLATFVNGMLIGITGFIPGNNLTKNDPPVNSAVYTAKYNNCMIGLQRQLRRIVDNNPHARKRCRGEAAKAAGYR